MLPVSMVRYMPQQLERVDVVLKALADPTRRRVVERLVSGPASTSALAQPFDMALPSFAQHLGVLERAGVVTSAKQGRTRTFQLAPDGLDRLKVCVAYEVDGERITNVPASIRRLERCTPIYEEFEGWNCPTTECTSWDELPEQAKKYVAYLEELTGVKVSILSVGPKRASTLLLDR